ncbi:MAG: MgtC/SapB family protein [bacterium]|nr:MgtC/SapB family protein [bacterium]
MLVIRELTAGAIFTRILAAVALGGVIGMERGLKNRPAGLRTYMLVCIGSCTVMIINQYAYQCFGSGDPVRMGAQVISGIGFLGAGTIIVTSHNQIRGLSTAAGLWATACFGLALGIGLYEAALISGAAVFIVLTLLSHWDHYMDKYFRALNLYVELDKQVPLGQFLRSIRDHDIELDDLQLERSNAFSDDIVSFVVTIKGKKRYNHEFLIQTVRNLEGVKFLEEI